MIIPKPPSFIEPVSTPLFGICWYGNPGDGLSLVAYCGGGGSAATGVRNTLTVRVVGNDLVEPLQISTGDDIGVSVKIIQNPLTQQLHLFCALGSRVVRYQLPEGRPTGEIQVGDGVNAVAINAMCDTLAVGCESGTVKMYKISDDTLGDLPVHVYEGHSKAVCAVVFSPREGYLLSSAKDGTARVWKNEECIEVLTCDVKDPKAPPPKRVTQVLVRGCAFGDLMGQLVYTIASGRRGKAYLAKWGMTPDKKHYKCIERTEVSPCPISAMCLSEDGGMMALGSVDGSLILWGIEKWRALKKFPEIHDLPVTCCAARPFSLPLRGDDGNIQMHALTASADSKLAWLSMSRPSRARSSKPLGVGGSISLQTLINFMARVAILGWIFMPVIREMRDRCEGTWIEGGYTQMFQCIRHEVLFAPDTVPGVLVPPH